MEWITALRAALGNAGPWRVHPPVAAPRRRHRHRDDAPQDRL